MKSNNWNLIVTKLKRYSIIFPLVTSYALSLEINQNDYLVRLLVCTLIATTLATNCDYTQKRNHARGAEISRHTREYIIIDKRNECGARTETCRSNLILYRTDNS